MNNRKYYLLMLICDLVQGALKMHFDIKNRGLIVTFLGGSCNNSSIIVDHVIHHYTHKDATNTPSMNPKCDIYHITVCAS